jgi:hypothetical protein
MNDLRPFFVASTQSEYLNMPRPASAQAFRPEAFIVVIQVDIV